MLYRSTCAIGFTHFRCVLWENINWSKTRRIPSSSKASQVHGQRQLMNIEIAPELIRRGQTDKTGDVMRCIKGLACRAAYNTPRLPVAF